MSTNLLKNMGVPSIGDVVSHLLKTVRDIPESSAEGNESEGALSELHLSSPFEQRLIDAIKLHNEGLQGNKAALQQALRMLAKLCADHPDRPLATAFHGSVQVLIARDETSPLKKMRGAFNGLKLLDEAVQADPKNQMIRMLRGNISYQLPEQFFHRSETVIEDYLTLIKEEIRQPGQIESETHAKMLYQLGDAYRRIGRRSQAKACWAKLLKQPEQTTYHALIRQKLRGQTVETDEISEVDLDTEMKASSQKSKTPNIFKSTDLFQWLGAIVCVTGASVVLMLHHNQENAEGLTKSQKVKPHVPVASEGGQTNEE